MCDFERELQDPLESQAPLADVQLPQRSQGLSLVDLEQWHAGKEPELKLTDLLEEDMTPAVSSFSKSPSVVRVKKKQENPEILLSECSESEVSVESLKDLFCLPLDSHQYALNQREDLRRLSKQSDLLFQKIPQYLERLNQVLYAHEQSQVLYTRLADLSKKRGSAALIIQTARQVEVLEKNLKEKRFRAEELKKMQSDLNAHLVLAQRYQDVFQQVSALDILTLD